MYTKIVHSHPLLDGIKMEFGLNSDAALAEMLGLPKPTISKIRSGKVPVSAESILSIYDATGWQIPVIRGLIKEAQLQEAA